MTKLIPLPRVTATALALLGPCLFALAAPASALAGSSTTATSTTASSENQALNLGAPTTGIKTSSGGASIVRTIVGLAIVLAVIWGLSWILRQVKSGRDPQVSSSGLESVAALTLSTGRSVHLVKAGSEYVLLGSAEHGVVPIHRYSEQEARDAGLLAVDVAPPARKHRALLAPRQSGAGGDSHTSHAAAGALLHHHPAGPRHDPMRMPSAGGALERLREWTVRR
jgi:flagellar protein FliO/FliZ